MSTRTHQHQNGTGAADSSTILGVKLSDHSRVFQLVFCCTAIFVGFLVNGICEEYVFRQLKYSYAWYFTFVQCVVYVFLAYMQGGYQKHIAPPWRTYFILGFVWVGSVGLTKASLKYINYPAQLMFKSSKIIPVMVMGAFIPGLRRVYSLYEYLIAVILVAGLIIFTLADVSVTPSFEITGLIMILVALVFDAFLGNIQEALFVSYPNITQEEVLFCTNLLSLPLLLVPMVGTGEIGSGWQSGLEFPSVYLIIVAASVATYIGQLAILVLIALFGAATAYMVTSLRKAFTISLSYVIFTKPFNFEHLLGIALIFLSLSMKMFPKQKHSEATTNENEREPILNSTSRGDETLSDTENGLQFLGRDPNERVVV